MDRSHPKLNIDSKTQRWQRRMRLCAFAIVVLFVCGCATPRELLVRRAAVLSRLNGASMVEVKPVRQGTILTPITSWIGSPEQPSERTVRLLRNFNLESRLAAEPIVVIDWLRELVSQDPALDEVHALAEICKIQADWQSKRGNHERAAGLYATAIISAHQFLFDPNLNVKLNAYDPQFRNICDIYNHSLKTILRESCKSQNLEPGRTIEVGDERFGFELSFEILGDWSKHQFEKFELVDDYVAEGIDNHYRTYGLGVPLIGVCNSENEGIPGGQYYPPSLTVPLTGFCEITNQSTEGGRRRAVLKLLNPLEKTIVQHHGMTIPLESDLTTPLAYHLNNPLLDSSLLATATLLDGELADGIHGMYMLSPFDPNKIPVVMVHGIWSSPVTWAHMFNDLRAIPEIHKHYQFWFYSYPTGQPFWISGRQMREDLARIRQELDPQRKSAALDDMVLIGHSMGGLVSQLQVINSGNQFWERLVSDRPFSELQGDNEKLQLLRDTFFFRANPSVDRVVMIGTPNHGSSVANAATRYIGQKLFTLPTTLTNDFANIVHQNHNILGDGTILTTSTSVDALAETSPIFQVMDTAERSPSVKYNNIIGQVPRKNLLSSKSTPSEGDGIVAVTSARTRHASSEIIVPAEHTVIHQHPQCILEVRKILTSNLVEKNLIRGRKFPAVPVTFEQPVATQKN